MSEQMNTIAQLIDAISDLIEPHTMAQDLDKARTAAHQQVMEAEQERVRGRARAILRTVWDHERLRAEASGSAFRAAHARAKIADLDREDAA